MINMAKQLKRFAPITLDEMKDIRLMNRMDTKFVTTIPRLMSLLSMAEEAYYVQDNKGERNAEYRTLYFDTSRHDMFRVHQAGHANRQKLRFRTYVSSHLQFMEVKTKNNHGRTKKKRMTVSNTDLTAEEKRVFLHQCLHYDIDRMHPALLNEFHRITLVNKAKTERLTIDTGLQFQNQKTGLATALDDLVVIELKRDGLQPSPVLEMLRQLHIHPHGFSKYCMGLAMTDPSLPVNQMKLKLRDVEKIMTSGS